MGKGRMEPNEYIDYGRQLDFAQFLLDRELINLEQATCIRRRSKHDRVPIGQLLITEGYCSVRQVMNLVAMQEENPGVRFGELAIRSGHLTSIELDDVLRLQGEYRYHQIEVALQQRLMPKEKLYRLVICYVRYMELEVSDEDEGLVDLTVSRAVA